MAEEYDISRAFERIEEELITSMIRNMDRHRAEESAYGYEWSQWQAEQLRSLEHYRAENQRKFGRQFSSLNQRIENAIRVAHEAGGMEQEEEILEAIRRGFTGYSHLPDAMIQGNFFRVNQRKLDALIQATTNDMRTAETAILRMANDQYRRVVFDAQVYAASGAGTYEKAVDMATHDMLAAGLNCVQYKNGARHTLADYADMAIRTACKRAKLQGEGQMRQEWGVSTVIMNKRGNPCPKCLPWVGKVLIDDVWSGGSRKDGPYPLMSTAIAAGLYHPRCKDGHVTFFEGIDTPPDNQFTRRELKQIEKDNRKEAQKQYAERQRGKFGRLADYSLDPENKRRYTARKNAWEQEKAVENRGGNGIIRVSQGSMAKARRPADAKERAQIINEAIRTKRPFYAEDLRQAYDLYGVKKEQGLYDVLIHGAPTFVEYEKKYVLDTETLYYIISGRKDYNGEDIRLLSCSTGKKDANGNCVAQELADLLNVKVYAPTDVLNIEPTGNLSVGKRKNGNFECFWKGKNMK
nr:MAG TPA: minor capsid protein [Caudoviricetes sp.]